MPEAQRSGALAGQVALVTGAASGIGLEIARQFAAAGAAVGLADVNVPAASAAVQTLTAAGGKAIVLAMDVTSEAQVEAGVARLVAEYGQLDVLVSNAGLQVISPLVDFALQDWNRVLAVHLDGAFLTTRASMRVMRATGGGSIIYMGSVHSHVASPLKCAYVTAKHGLLGLTRAVAREGAALGIRANLICPGFVRTALVERQIPEQAVALGLSEAEVIREVMLKDTVDGEFTSAADVARTALFLAGFGSAALTGQSIAVSHGWHMGG